MNRFLIVLFDGKPGPLCLTFGEVREEIAKAEFIDVSKITVWRIYHRNVDPEPQDCTTEFAFDWARRVEAPDSESLGVYLASFSAFLRHHAKDALIEKFNGRAA